MFVYHGGTLIGFGRTLDDEKYYALIVDVAVKPEFQGAGFGRDIVTYLKDQLSSYRFITLTCAPGKDEFYTRLGWQKQKSAFIWPVSENQKILHT